MSMPMKKGQGLTWSPASVELPEIPAIQGGQDALSSTIAAVLPTLGVPLAANVATLQAKEGTFAGKLGVAEAAYAASDDSGQQSVGQLGGMLGQLGQQVGQMGQMAGAPAQAAGQGSGMFGSLIQQAMQGANGGGDGQSSGAQVAASPVAGSAPVPNAAAPSAGAPGGAPPSRADDATAEHRDDQSNRHESQRDREPLQRADDRTLAGPTHDGGPSAGAAPVEPPRHTADDDLGRRL
jgi:hypothetical protein